MRRKRTAAEGSRLRTPKPSSAWPVWSLQSFDFQSRYIELNSVIGKIILYSVHRLRQELKAPDHPLALRIDISAREYFLECSRGIPESKIQGQLLPSTHPKFFSFRVSSREQ
jgi:hypothetical protein